MARRRGEQDSRRVGQDDVEVIGGVPFGSFLFSASTRLCFQNWMEQAGHSDGAARVKSHLIRLQRKFYFLKNENGAISRMKQHDARDR